jgi:hypothetical protein
MAHKGKIWEIDQRGRIYQFDAIWPLFPAKRYQVVVTGWFFMSLSTLLIDNDQSADGAWVDFEPASHDFSYRAPFNNSIGHTVEAGCSFTWDEATQLSNWQAQLWLDGIAQLPVAAPSVKQGDWTDRQFPPTPPTPINDLWYSGFLFFRPRLW